MTYTAEIQDKARALLSSGEVVCVIGYELGPRGRTRPAFIYRPEDVERLVWNRQCTHNLVTYLHDKLKPGAQDAQDAQKEAEAGRVAIVVKPCDSRAINVLLAEHRFARAQVHIIGVACDGILEGAGFGRAADSTLQKRCTLCDTRTPAIYDSLIGEPAAVEIDEKADMKLAALDAMSPADRAAFWLAQFDRCIRCYACRQVCPMCDCPVCLYERDDSLWVSMGIDVDAKRTFHLGRAYHLAGRCIGCGECTRVCPVHIPVGLLNRKLAQEVEAMFGYRAGLEPTPSPITTILAGEEV